MNAKQFGERVAALRKARGLTQAQLAEKLNISNKAISRWETGEGFPEITLLSPLAKVLGITIDQLLAEDDAGTVDPNIAALHRQKQLKHQEIPVVWPKLRLKESVGSPYFRSNFFHIVYFAVLTGIVFSSNVYTADGAQKFIGFLCPASQGYLVKGLLAASLFLIIILNIRLYRKHSFSKWIVLRNIAISTFFTVGLFFSFEHLNLITYGGHQYPGSVGLSAVYYNENPGTILHHNYVRVDRNHILLISIASVLIYIFSDCIRVLKRFRKQAASQAEEFLTQIAAFWCSLTIFNKIAFAAATLSTLVMLTAVLFYMITTLFTVPQSHEAMVGIARPSIGYIIIVMAASVCSTAVKAGFLSALVGLGAGLLDLYDRQSRAGAFFLIINLIFIYLFPLVLVVLQITNMISFSNVITDSVNIKLW